jgi:hypothetical protein
MNDFLGRVAEFHFLVGFDELRRLGGTLLDRFRGGDDSGERLRDLEL